MASHLSGIDVDETIRLVVKQATIRIALSLAASQHWHIHQLDAKNAFFHGIFVTRDSSGLFLSQHKYVVEILKWSHMCRTPVDIESKLGLDDDPTFD
ncbi:ribonuclease H-like domain-containing protein [Tanacetum coccineum]